MSYIFIDGFLKEWGNASSSPDPWEETWKSGLEPELQGYLPASTKIGLSLKGVEPLLLATGCGTNWQISWAGHSVSWCLKLPCFFLPLRLEQLMQGKILPLSQRVSAPCLPLGKTPPSETACQESLSTSIRSSGAYFWKKYLVVSSEAPSTVAHFCLLWHNFCEGLLTWLGVTNEAKYPSPRPCRYTVLTWVYSSRLNLLQVDYNYLCLKDFLKTRGQLLIWIFFKYRNKK